jgi:PQQ-like domain
MRRKRRTVRGSPAWMRRGVLAVVLLAVAFSPAPGSASGQQAPACHGCRTQPASAQRWVSRLPGEWTVGDGVTGTVPASGQAYVAVGGGVAAVGAGLTVSGFGLRDGRLLWQVTLPEPAGAAIMSVRAWPGVVTAGVSGPSGRTRTEVVIDSRTGAVADQYPAAVYGGAVEASAATSVIIGPRTVTSYDNGNGTMRWRLDIGAGQAWRTDGSSLFVAESAGGYLGSAPVTGLRVIDLDTGTERTLGSPPGHPFSGTLAVAADDAVLFSSASGVTAYSGSTGRMLWSRPGVVPEGTDPVADLVYLTSARGFLVGVNPVTGALKAFVTGSTAAGSAGIYVVRGGVALGLDSGQGGEAWGYNLSQGRVTWTIPGLPWPHYFADLSGLGGSAATSADVVVVAACARLAPAPAVSASPTVTVSPTAKPPATITPSAFTGRGAGAAAANPLRVASSPAASPSAPATASPTGPSASSASTATPTPTPTPTPPPVHPCADPELVALNV